MTHEQKVKHLRSVQKSIIAIQKQIHSNHPGRWRWDVIVAAIVVAAAAAGFLIITASLLRRVETELSNMEREIQAGAEAFRRDERAWIEIEPVKPVWMAPTESFVGARFQYDLYVKNIGKTVADGIRVRAVETMAGMELSDDGSGLRVMQDGDLTEAGGNKLLPVPAGRAPRILAPGAVAAVPFTLTATGPSDGGFHYLIGRVDYRDVFSGSHWMTFCFMVANFRGELVYCQGGNDVDRNP